MLDECRKTLKQSFPCLFTGSEAAKWSDNATTPEYMNRPAATDPSNVSGTPAPISNVITGISSVGATPMEYPVPGTMLRGRSLSAARATQHPSAADMSAMFRPIVRTPISPSPRTPDDEVLAQLSADDLIARIKIMETKNRKLLFENGCLMKDLNFNLASIQQLKQQNQQLMQDNNELRDLCCYLDDERTRARTIAHEWSSFGSHVSKVMRKEIGNYSSKLAALECKQFELVRENYELKQLCLMLDNAVTVRENGDGSCEVSGNVANTGNLTCTTSKASTLPNAPFSIGSKLSSSSSLGTTPKAAEPINASSAEDPGRITLNRQILEYIKSLEQRITELELDRKRSDHGRTDESAGLHDDSGVSTNPPISDAKSCTKDQCPSTISETMNVLRIQESMNDSSTTPALDVLSTNDRNNNRLSDDVSNESQSTSGLVDNSEMAEQQKQIVRQLCDAALRKIEDG